MNSFFYIYILWECALTWFWLTLCLCLQISIVALITTTFYRMYQDALWFNHQWKSLDGCLVSHCCRGKMSMMMTKLRRRYILYNIFKKKIVLNLYITNLHTVTMNPSPFIFLKAQLQLQGKKKVQQKTLFFKLRNKKPIKQILKNHK